MKPLVKAWSLRIEALDKTYKIYASSKYAAKQQLHRSNPETIGHVKTVKEIK